uniref:Uncharacterized protein n=1 Tax=Aegilops tauschii subsp. strangulata TaxID=200361 RepID=A0A453J367_AEGTS
AAAAPDLPIDLLASPPPPPRHPTLARPLVLRAAPSSTAEELLPRLQPRRRRLVHCLGVGEEATLQFWSRPAVLLPPPATPVQIDTLVLPRLQATAGEKMEGTREQPEEAAEPPTTLAMEIQFRQQDEQVSTLLELTEQMQ